MRRVILESPYAGDVERNVRYARACLRDSLRRGEAPIASHLLYTQPGVLDDAVPEERAQGIAAGLAWGRTADATVVYTGSATTGLAALRSGRAFLGCELHPDIHAKACARLEGASKGSAA